MNQSLYDLIFGGQTDDDNLNTYDNWVLLGKGELDDDTAKKIIEAGYENMVKED